MMYNYVTCHRHHSSPLSSFMTPRRLPDSCYRRVAAHSFVDFGFQTNASFAIDSTVGSAAVGLAGAFGRLFAFLARLTSYLSRLRGLAALSL